MSLSVGAGLGDAAASPCAVSGDHRAPGSLSVAAGVVEDPLAIRAGAQPAPGARDQGVDDDGQSVADSARWIDPPAKGAAGCIDREPPSLRRQQRVESARLAIRQAGPERAPKRLDLGSLGDAPRKADVRKPLGPLRSIGEEGGELVGRLAGVVGDRPCVQQAPDRLDRSRRLRQVVLRIRPHVHQCRCSLVTA